MLKISDILLFKLIQYLRYGRQVFDFHTEYEYRGFKMDLACSKDSELWEFEIKTSKQDFLNDFKNKKIKHERWNNGEGPTKLWYVIPNDNSVDIEFVKNYLKENYNKYGLILADPRPCHPSEWYSSQSFVFKTAYILSASETPDLFKGCDYAGLTRKVLDYHYKIQNPKQT